MTGGLGFDSYWRERLLSHCPDMQGYSLSVLFKGYVGGYLSLVEGIWDRKLTIWLLRLIKLYPVSPRVWQV